RLRRAFHEEEFTAGAMRVALHHHRPIANVRQQDVGDVGVVLQQIAFGESGARPEDLAKVGQSNVFALDLQDHVVLVAGDDQALHVARLQASCSVWVKAQRRELGGRTPWRTAPMTGTDSSSAPSLA